MPDYMKYLRGALLIVSFFISGIEAFSQFGSTPYSQVSSFENYIHAKCKEVEQSGRTIENLSASDLQADLPVGIARQIGNTKYIIAIDSAYRAERGGWFFSAYASITFPGTTTPIAFAAKNIGFNNGGLTTSTQVRLMLVSTKNIPVNENLTIQLPADERNFVEFDCNGFKSVNIKGDFIFSRGILVPDVEKSPQSESVTATFEINTSDLSNIMTAVSVTPFKISGLNDLSFEITNAIMDFSDISNPSGFSLPQDYQHAYGDDINLWRGFYLQDVSITIDGFSGNDAMERPMAHANNLLIDDLGVSGNFSASNLFTLQNGSADGWPFSVDQMSVKLLFNQVNGGSLAGFLSIPLLGNEPVAYTAMIEQDQIAEALSYRFSLSTPTDKEYETPFSAMVKIEKGSVISLEKNPDGRFIPSALLHGSLSVEKGELSVDKIRFENLGLTSLQPYVVSGDFSTAGSGQARTVGFPVRIDSVNLRVYQGQAGLGFAVALNFMNKEDKGFGASTYVQLLAKMNEPAPEVPDPEAGNIPNGKQEWQFDKVKINDVSLDCRTQAFTLAGRLSLFNDDAVYGDGFHGNLQFSIRKILERGVKVNAYFGSKETFRYWHVDAFVPTGTIPLLPPVSINGFMGGASYKMVRQKPLIPDFTQLGPEAISQVSTGNANTALVYLPDEKAAMSFLAGVTLIVANEKAVNADAMLEVAFNQGGGIKYAQFDGSAFFMTAIKSRGRVQGGNVPKAPVYAAMNMLYDNDNDVFHANLKTYVNLAGVIQGVGSNGLVGEAVIHVDRKDWYFYIGRPTQMLGVSVASLATAQTYFMIGTKIENLPPPPPEVREIFGDIDLSLMRDDLAAAGGKGFATGVHFKVGFDSKNKLRPFYISLMAGAGADIMLRNYGNAYCAGSDGKIGIDGWYASGQAYVFLNGRVGIMVKKKQFDIVSLGLAALLQAKLPNPAWMKGQLAGRYSVLGGLVKGKFHLKFTIGEECEIVQPGSEIDDIIVIADLKPDNAGADVSVFTAPQASFNTSIDTEFTMMDLRDEKHSYRIKLDEMTLYNGNAAIPANLTWNNTKDVAVLKTAEILPQQSNLRVLVKIHWEKKVNSGFWESMKDASGKIIYEKKETIFATGDAPNFIPEENVLYSYPIKQQHNLHVDESPNGYVKLNYGQAYLFEPNGETQSWEFLARFNNGQGKISEVPLQYNVSDASVTFSFPDDLQEQSIYNLTFIKKPRTTTPIDANVKRTTVQLAGGDGNEVATSSNMLQGSIKQNVEKDIYKTVFRTSQYSTFRDKWAALGMNGGQDLFDIATGNIAVIGKRALTTEAFDEFELRGNNRINPLIEIKASPENAWMKNSISPLLYDLYPYDKDVTISWRETSELGLKPLKAVTLSNNVNDFRLTDAEIASGVTTIKNASVMIGYYLSFYTFWDYSELLNKAAGKYLDNWGARPEGVKRLLAATGYTDLVAGQYPVEITYTLPGETTPTFTTEVAIKF